MPNLLSSNTRGDPGFGTNTKLLLLMRKRIMTLFSLTKNSSELVQKYIANRFGKCIILCYVLGATKEDSVTSCVLSLTYGIVHQMGVAVFLSLAISCLVLLDIIGPYSFQSEILEPVIHQTVW